MKKVMSLIVMVLLVSPVFAAPPPGHPSVAEAQDEMGMLKDEPLVHSGKVLQSIASNDYVYIEVTKKPSGTRWIAAPRIELKNDTVIQYSDGVVMHDFFSQKHKRTFPEVMFVDRVEK